MKLTKQLPDSRLSNYIRFFWYMEGQEQSSDFKKILPFGALDIIIHKAQPMLLNSTEGKYEPRAFVEGQYMKFQYKKPSQHTAIVGISLQPWTSKALFGIPGEEFTDQLLPIDLLSTNLQKLEELVQKSSSETDLFKIMNNHFLDHLSHFESHDRPQLRLFSHQLIRQGFDSIEHIAEKYWGGSLRKLQLDFRETFGITMSQYRRKVKFQKAIALLHDRRYNLTDITYDCGFFDQSHFTRTFREFTGINPKSYLTQAVSNQPLTLLGALAE